MAKKKDVNKHYQDFLQEIEVGQQHVIKKNWKFYKFPIIILTVLLLDLFWEVLRNYMPNTVWPWKFTVLGVNTAASLSGVFGALILTREQFARTIIPNLSWSTSFKKIYSLDEPAWVAYLLNVGPGTANISSVKYSIFVIKDSTTTYRKDISITTLKTIFTEIGLIEGQDYHLKVVTKGLPLPPVKKPDEGIEFFAIKTECLTKIKNLNFHVTVMDSLGDLHLKTLSFIATLPEKYETVRLTHDKLNK